MSFVMIVQHVTSLKTAALAAVFVFMAACQSSSTSRPVLILQHHPLAGKIWDVRQAKFISREALLQMTSSADYLLLGENHDNAVHHRYQAEIISYLGRQGIAAGVAFEMIDEKQNLSIKERQVASADELISLLDVSSNNWNYQRDYRGVFSAVITAGFPVYAANYHRVRLRELISRKKEKPADEIVQLIRSTPLGRQHRESLQKEIIRSHCGHADKKMTEKMIDAQQLRDAKMAYTLLNISEAMKILIAGSGHTRNDRAVPRYLVAADSGAKVLSVAWLGVLPGRKTVSEYGELWADGKPPFDIIWFTPRVNRPDFCEEMKKHFTAQGKDSHDHADKKSSAK